MLVKTFVCNPFQENTYVLYDETREAVIIDCGAINRHEEHTIAQFIEQEDLTVKHLLNTHLHLDHIFGNHWAAHKYGLKPLANQADEYLIDEMPKRAAEMGLPYEVHTQHLGGYLRDNETICFGVSELKTILVPGHTPGSICFYDAKEGFLFAGDVLFCGSIGRTDLPGGDYATLIRGIQTRLLTLPDETIVFCGHGPSTTIGAERTGNPFL